MKKICLLTFLISPFLFACEDKVHSCYDASIVHNRPCTHDCPGVIGCDGKEYCNACEAARHGIKVK